MSIDWSRLAEIIRQGQRFLITSHVRPDCDSLGSELALAAILRKLGKQAVIVNADPTPPHVRFIDPDERIKTLGANFSAAECQPFDVLVVVDTSAWIQLGPMADVLRETTAKRVVIDHHQSQDDLGAEDFKDPDAEATGRLLVDAADALGVELDEEIAAALFAAIATDTGWMRFPSTTGQTFRTMSRLVEAGAAPHEIFSALYERNSLARLLLRGRILSQIKAEVEGRIVIGSASREDLAATGAEPSDTEDVVNMFLTVAECEVAVLLLEMPDGQVKASLRSEGAIDVRQVAERFGGGGHTAAAGVLLEGPLDAARQRILDALREVMR